VIANASTRLLLACFFLFETKRMWGIDVVMTAMIIANCILNLILFVGQIYIFSYTAFIKLYRRYKLFKTIWSALPEPNSSQLTKIQNGDSACPICFDTMLTSLNAFQVLVATPCGHFFHRKCLSEWLVIQNSCPMCHCLVLSLHR
jgi:Ring finger domain